MNATSPLHYYSLQRRLSSNHHQDLDSSNVEVEPDKPYDNTAHFFYETKTPPPNFMKPLGVSALRQSHQPRPTPPPLSVKASHQPIFMEKLSKGGKLIIKSSLIHRVAPSKNNPGHQIVKSTSKRKNASSGSPKESKSQDENVEVPKKIMNLESRQQGVMQRPRTERTENRRGLGGVHIQEIGREV